MSGPRWRSVAVITPEDGGVHVVRMRRRGAAYEATGDAHVQLRLSLFGDAVELVSRDLRDRLREQGIQERHWILAVPPSWLVSRSVSFPDVQLGDEREFLWLQAEQTLLAQGERPALAVSRYALPDGTRGATLFVFSSDRLDRVRQVLTKAGLRLLAAAPAGVCKSDAGMPAPAGAMIGAGNMIRLQVSAGGGIVLLRDIPRPAGPLNADGVRHIQRHLRIALASLPDAVRSALQSIDWADETGRNTRFASIWEESEDAVSGAVPALRAADLQTTAGAEFAVGQFLAQSSLSCFGVRHDQVSRPSTLRRILRSFVPIAVCLAALIAPVAHQAWRLRTLQRELNHLTPRADVIESARSQVKELSRWYDCRPATLDILRAITHAFPEYGTVWVTRFSVADERAVELSGKTTDPGAWLAMQDVLRNCPAVSDLRVSQTRTASGNDATMTFGITFTWEGLRQ